jgi:eukaryotic-like serine/threonine-protein kinase
MKVSAVSAAADSAGRYAVGRVLGRGGMATVYLAHDRELERPVALKILAAELAMDDSARDRFVREARLAAKIVHPNVVQVYDAGEGPLGPFIVAEYVGGGTLSAELRRRGRLPAEEVAAIGTQVADGLSAAHAEGVVHRDVKPGNILLSESGRAKIADFGIARSLAATRHTELGTVLGTAASIAPEQARGGSVTPAVDVYALGVVLYELLSGETPFTSATPEELLSTAPRPSPIPLCDVAPDVPAPLEAVVMQCLAHVPEYRPSAWELAGRLESTDEEPRTVPLPVVLPAAGRRPVRRNLLVGLAAVIAGGAIGVAAVPTGKQSGRDGATPPTTTRAPVVRRSVATVRPQPVTQQTSPPTGPSLVGRENRGGDHDDKPKPKGKAKGHHHD